MSLPSVTFKCGSCGQLLSIGSELAGQVARCPYCQLAVQVPSVEPAVVSAAEEAATLVMGEGQASGPPAANAEPELVVHSAAENGAPPGADIVPSASDSQLAPWLKNPTHDEVKTEPLPEAADRTREWTPASSPSSAAPPDGTDVNPWDRTELLDAPTSSTSTVTPPVPAPGQPAGPTRRKLPASVWLLSFLLPYALIMTAGTAFLAYRGLDRPVHPLEALQDQGLYEDMAFDGRRRETPPNLAEVKDKNGGVQVPTVPLAPWMPRLKLGETGRFGGIEVTPLSVTRRKLEFVFSAEERPANEPEALVLRLRIKNVSDLIFHPDDATFNRAFLKDPGPYTFLEIGARRFYGAVRDAHSERLKGPNFAELLPGGELETMVTAVLSNTRESAVAALSRAPSDAPLLWRVHLRKGREDIRLKVSGRVRTLWTTTIVPVIFTPVEVKASTPSSAAARPS